MALTYHPRIGAILMCDFSRGFEEPEMVKKRPVIILSVQGYSLNDGLATVVPLSTSEPRPVKQYHHLLDSKLLPRHELFFQKENWIKGDMTYTVGFQRLTAIQTGRNRHGKREYLNNRLSRQTMTIVYTCVLHGLNLGGLAQYLDNNQ